MIPASIPTDEVDRLAALQRYEVLDTPPEPAFDRVTRLASQIIGTPIALVSLIDATRQWFKSHHGLDATETPREQAFCAHAILGQEVFIVPDAREDKRFEDNPLVTSAPKVIFYAGAPLTAPDGHRLGTLCVIDHEPRRELTETQRTALTDLAAITVDLLELRRAGRNALGEIVERNRINEELSRLSREAEAAERAMGAFLATMSHELRTPMNGVVGMTSLLLDTPLTPDQHRYVQAVRSAADTLLSVVNDVLDYSKLEAGRIELEALDFNLANCITSVTTLLESSASAKGLTLATSIAPGTPKRLVGDVGRLRQILFNLVGNAIKFTEKGSVTIEVHPASQTADKVMLRFVVRDTGIGIPPEVRADLFTRFTQANCTIARKYGGTGLGLAICRQLCTLMDGTIGVESIVGQGSAFWFDLPFAPAAETAPPKPAITAAVPVEPLRILVAEDNRTNQMVVTAALGKHGHTIDVVANGLEAVEAVQRVPYDVVLMDDQMPEMDGVEAAKTIRALKTETAKVPIIALTGNVLPEDKARYLEAGMTEHVAKPVDFKLLQSVIARVTAKK
ncbi:MAG: ATP-binding protein [Alphaproteobacteria bacterium]